MEFDTPSTDILDLLFDDSCGLLKDDIPHFGTDSELGLSGNVKHNFIDASLDSEVGNTNNLSNIDLNFVSIGYLGAFSFVPLSEFVGRPSWTKSGP